MKVTIFTELNSSMKKEEAKKSYPDGMNGCLYDFISKAHDVKMIVQKEGDDGSELTEDILKDTDVLIWWGHHYHNNVSDAVVDKVCEYVNRGMGFIPMHSAHKSKPFMRLIGSTGDLSWREIGENERLWAIDPTHPIAAGLEKAYVDIPHEEMYGEPFIIPTPDELVFIGWFKGGEVMRSGCVFKRGRGKMFYFQPGHETLAVYSIPEIQKIILNAIDYVKSPVGLYPPLSCTNVTEPLEKI